MQTFSSALKKPGKKIAPRSIPRRNVPRPAKHSQTGAPTNTSENANTYEHLQPQSLNRGPLPTPPASLSSQQITNGEQEDLTPRRPVLEVEVLQRNRHASSSVKIPTPTSSVKSTQAASQGDVQLTASSTRTRLSEGGDIRRASRRSGASAEGEIDHTSATQSSDLVRGWPGSLPLPRKRRKILSSSLSESDSHPLLAPISIASTTPISRYENGSLASDTTDPNVLLEKARTQAAAVSLLAENIGGGTQPRRKRTGRTQRETEVVLEAVENGARGKAKSLAKRSRKKRSLAEVVDEIVADAVGVESSDSGRPQRRATPEGAEDHKIEETDTKMGTLCKDSRLGKKSVRESAMQKLDWDGAVKQQWKKEADERRARRDEIGQRKAGRARPGTTAEGELEGEAAAVEVIHLVPQLRIEHGRIVTDQESREIDLAMATQTKANDRTEIPVDDDALTRRVNQGTIGAPRGVRKSQWDDEMTDRFYQGLRMWGQDFAMIASMFPGMGIERKHVKLKYNKEERVNLAKVNEHLINRAPVILEEFQEITGIVYDEIGPLREAMLEQEQRMLAEDEERRANEAGGTAGDGEDEDGGTVLPSREQGSNPLDDIDGEAEVPADGNATARENRFSSIDDSIVRSAVSKKKTRKQTGKLKKATVPISKKGKKATEGQEEVLGPVDQVEI